MDTVFVHSTETIAYARRLVREYDKWQRQQDRISREQGDANEKSMESFNGE